MDANPAAIQPMRRVNGASASATEFSASSCVQIQIPANPNMSRVARLAAGGVCSLMGLDIEQIEDVKIAVSEVILALIEHGEGQDVALTFELPAVGGSSLGVDDPIDADVTPELIVTGATMCANFDETSADLDLCRAVLAGVSKSYSIESNATRAEIRVVLPGAPA
jgi:hypothetical protein